MIFRAIYERKKSNTQDERYTIALEEAERKEQVNLSLDEIEAVAMKYWDRFYDVDKDRIDAELLAVVLKREEIIPIGHNKLQRLKLIEYDHPELFNQPETPNVKTPDKET